MYDDLNIETGDLGRSPRATEGGAVKLKRKAPELVRGSAVDLGVVGKRMKQEAADAMESEEDQFDQRYNHGSKGGATRKRCARSDKVLYKLYADTLSSQARGKRRQSLETRPL